MVFRVGGDASACVWWCFNVGSLMFCGLNVVFAFGDCGFGCPAVGDGFSLVCLLCYVWFLWLRLAGWFRLVWV